MQPGDLLDGARPQDPSSSDRDANDANDLTSPFASEAAVRMKYASAVRDMIADMEEEAIMLEPAHVFDPCILGLTEGDLGPVRVIYDSERCVHALMQSSGMSWDEAYEFFSFNTLGTHVTGYPLFLCRPAGYLVDPCDRMASSETTPDI